MLLTDECLYEQKQRYDSLFGKFDLSVEPDPEEDEGILSVPLDPHVIAPTLRCLNVSKFQTP